PPGGYLPDGRGRSLRRRPAVAGTRRGRSTGRRRVDHPGDHQRQHERSSHDDRRTVCRTDDVVARRDASQAPHSTSAAQHKRRTEPLVVSTSDPTADTTSTRGRYTTANLTNRPHRTLRSGGRG